MKNKKKSRKKVKLNMMTNFLITGVAATVPTVMVARPRGNCCPQIIMSWALMTTCTDECWMRLRKARLCLVVCISVATTKMSVDLAW